MRDEFAVSFHCKILTLETNGLQIEFIHIEPEDIVSDFETVRNVSGGITANFKCGASLKTEAGAPGSLEKQDTCIIEFDTTRPTVWSLPVSQIDDTSGGSLLTDCGYDACEFDVDEGKVFQFATVEGCLLSGGDKMFGGKIIRTRVCQTREKNQLWKVHDNGKISSMVDSDWCFAKFRQNLVIDKCDGDRTVRFGYNVFDKSLYLLDEFMNMVVSTGDMINRKVRITSKVGTSNEHIELVY